MTMTVLTALSLGRCDGNTEGTHQHSGQESEKQSRHHSSHSGPLVRGKWFISYSIQSPDARCQSVSKQSTKHFNLFYHQMYLGLCGVLKGRGVLNPYGTRLDGWWVSYGLLWTVRKTHFLRIYLKSQDTGLDGEKEEMYLLLSGLSWSWSLSRLLIKYSVKNSQSQSLSLALYSGWYLENICIYVFVVNLPIPTRSK